MARSTRSFLAEAERLRACGRTYREIVAEWKLRYGFNSRIAYRLAHGFTQAEVARRWNEMWPDAEKPKTAKQISYWEIWPGAAGRAPSAETLNRLALLYRCSAGELLDGEDHTVHEVVPSPGTSVPAVTRFHADGRMGTRTSIVPVGAVSRVTERVVEDFEVLTDTYRHLDYREGAQQVAAEVGMHLRRMLEVGSLTTTTTVHNRLLRAAGDAAQLAAWLAIDGQRYEEAAGYCALTVSLADKANDRALHAYGLGVTSYIHLHACSGRAALEALEPARELASRGVPAAVRAWIDEAICEAHGLMDRPARGLAYLAEAERAFDGVTAGNTPAWLGFFNASCHAARLKGRALTRLGHPKDATRALYEALTLLPATFVRERSGTLIDLAMAYVQLRQIEQACDVAVEADVLARRTGSGRNRNRLRQLLLDLMPFTGEDSVRRLYHQVLVN